jgi:hypothetical protein
MAAEDPHLFDPGPPEREPEPEPAGALYRPKKKQHISTTEEHRVLLVYKQHIEARAVEAAAAQQCDYAHALGLERGVLLRDLVALAEKEQVHYYTGRKQGDHAKQQRAAEDSVRTQLRQFWEGYRITHTVQVLIEATIRDREGNAYPGAFYSLQRRLPT